MPASTGPSLGIKYGWPLGDFYKTEMDTNLKRLDRLVMPSVINATSTAPPESPNVNGDRYIIAATATGVWAGKENQIATTVSGAWEYETPSAGWSVRNLDTGDWLYFNGSTWVSAPIINNVRGSITVDMANADYTLTDSEAESPVILILNPGNGSKTLTIPAVPNTPAQYAVYVFGAAPVKIAYSGEGYYAAAYPGVVSNVLRLTGIGIYPADNQAVVLSNQGGTTTPVNPDTTANNEHVIEQMIVPADCWENYATLQVNFSALKSSTATTETLQVRVGNQGDLTDVSVWTNTQLATTTVGIAFQINIQKINATTVRVVSVRNGTVSGGTSSSSSSFVNVTVDDMDANPVYISVTGQNSTGAESVTSKYFRGILSR